MDDKQGTIALIPQEKYGRERLILFGVSFPAEPSQGKEFSAARILYDCLRELTRCRGVILPTFALFLLAPSPLLFPDRWGAAD
jgi:hypothetical protein